MVGQAPVQEPRLAEPKLRPCRRPAGSNGEPLNTTCKLPGCVGSWRTLNRPGTPLLNLPPPKPSPGSILPRSCSPKFRSPQSTRLRLGQAADRRARPAACQTDMLVRTSAAGPGADSALSVVRTLPLVVTGYILRHPVRARALRGLTFSDASPVVSWRACRTGRPHPTVHSVSLRPLTLDARAGHRVQNVRKRRPNSSAAMTIRFKVQWAYQGGGALILLNRSRSSFI